MSALDVLTAARAKVAQGWTQDVMARDGGGHGVLAQGPGAVCWCAYGALVAARASDRSLVAAHAALRQAIADPRRTLAVWNDVPGRTQAEVLAAFDAAIAAQEDAS